jgi:hypothetical protein
MANTYVKILSLSVSGVNPINITSIPSTYTDLLVVISARDTASGGSYMTINGTTTGYSERLLFTGGSTVNSANQATTNIGWSYLTNTSFATANTFSNCEFYIPNYAGSTSKTIASTSVTENNGAAANIYVNSALWSNGAAINSLSLVSSGGVFASDSTVTLYGIKKN